MFVAWEGGREERQGKREKEGREEGEEGWKATRLGETPKTECKEKQMNQIVFEMNNKTTVREKEKKN